MKTQIKSGSQSIAGSSCLLFYPICFSSQAGPAFLWEPRCPAWYGAWDGSCLWTEGAGGSLWVPASILQLALKLLPSSFLMQERFLSPTWPCGKVHQGRAVSASLADWFSNFPLVHLAGLGLCFLLRGCPSTPVAASPLHLW